MLFIIVFVINNHINTVQSLAIYVNVCSSLITKSPFQAFRGCRRWSEVKGKNSKGFFPGFSVSLLFISRHFPLTKTADMIATNKLNFERPCNERPKDSALEAHTLNSVSVREKLWLFLLYSFVRQQKPYLIPILNYFISKHLSRKPLEWPFYKSKESLEMITKKKTSWYVVGRTGVKWKIRLIRGPCSGD